MCLGTGVWRAEISDRRECCSPPSAAPSASPSGFVLTQDQMTTFYFWVLKENVNPTISNMVRRRPAIHVRPCTNEKSRRRGTMLLKGTKKLKAAPSSWSQYPYELWLSLSLIFWRINPQPGTGTSTFQSFLKVVIFFAISLRFGETSRSAL